MKFVFIFSNSFNSFINLLSKVAHPAGNIRVQMNHGKGDFLYGNKEKRYLTMNLLYRSMILFVEDEPRFSFAIPPEWVRAFKKYYWPTLYPKITGPQTDFYNYTDVSPIRTNKNFVRAQYDRTTYRYGFQREPI